MCDCNYTIVRKPIMAGHHSYYRHPNKMPYTGWHVKAERPNYSNYILNGSYAGRHRRNRC
jgi:hypothetical protein